MLRLFRRRHRRHAEPSSKRSIPNPASAFDAEPSQTVIPDVNVRPKQGGGWQVELNSDTLPKVLTNQRYYTEISDGARNKADKEFLAEKWNSANWLVKALDQRARTILRVAREIVRQQDLFLIKGVEHSAPARAARHRGSAGAARKHRQPRHQQQVHGDAARYLRTQVLLSPPRSAAPATDRPIPRRRSATV